MFPVLIVVATRGAACEVDRWRRREESLGTTAIQATLYHRRWRNRLSYSHQSPNIDYMLETVQTDANLVTAR